MSISPKQKVSKGRRDRRRAQNFKIAMPNLVSCKQCGELVRSHHVCKSCGTYKGREYIVLD